MSAEVHVVGAGLAGLTAALALMQAGRRVAVYEAGPVAGGRCRSYFDRALATRIDNGNHLLLSGNRHAHAYLQRLGTRHTLTGPGRPLFPFLDLESGERWMLRPSAGRLPWWIGLRRRRIPGTRMRDYLGLWRLLRPAAGTTVAALVGKSRLWRRLLEPLAVAALNTLPEQASARLFAAVVKETLFAGGAACVPAFPGQGLSESLVDPAVDLLRQGGASVAFGRRVAALEFADDR
ncbi:MAG: FAD-dependent oxidoreductase, partial [Alphaproteobacteria bacterium]|nr:FAD-dependent oxidoreductase [Alphaproteobacteria bacterium]